MKRNFKKLVAAILTMALVIGNVPVGIMQAKAEDADSQNVVETVSEVATTPVSIVAEGTCGEDLTWTLDENGVLTISGTGEVEDAPWESYCDSICSVVVSEGITNIICYDAFYGCTSLTSVQLPEGFTAIEDFAFESCSLLTSINLPDSITSIGECAFAGCDSLTNINFPESLTHIGNYAFSQCSSLTNVQIPEGVTSISKGTFEYCSSLTSVQLPDGIVSIGETAFEDCYSLTNINFPESLTRIGDRAFSLCDSLINVQLPEGLTSIGERAFESCFSLTNVEFPESLTSIGNYAFHSCYSLTNIDISNGVTSIGEGAFEACEALTGELVVPDGIVTLKKSVFSETSEIESIVFGKGLTEIYTDSSEREYYHALYGMTSVTEVTFTGTTVPTMTNTDYGPFEYMTSLETVYVPSEAYSDYVSAFKDYLPSAAIIMGTGDVVAEGTCGGNLTWTLDKNGVLTISGTGTEIDNYPNGAPWSSYSDSILSLKMPEGLQHIGAMAFNGCSALETVEFPDSLISIGSVAFSQCDTLTNINFPENLKSISNYAFSGCDALTSIELPDGITSIGEAAFVGCKGFTGELVVPDGITALEKSALGGTSGIESLVFGKGLTEIYTAGSMEHALYNMTGVKTVTFTGMTVPTMTNTDYGPFEYMTSLETVYVPSEAYSDYVSAFANYLPSTVQIIGVVEIIAKGTCGENLAWTLDENGVLTISGTGSQIAEYINEKAPWYSYREQIYSLVLPESLQIIGACAFNSCNALTRVELPNNLRYIGSMAFAECDALTRIELPKNLKTISTWAFAGCDALITVDLPEGITGIWQGAFSDCRALTSITIPEGITEIDDWTFNNCFSLVSIELPDSLIRIGDSAFNSCKSLAGIELPTNLKSIDGYAFNSCESITSIAIPEGITNIGNGTFSGSISLTSIELPESLTSIGSWAFTGCFALKSITFPEGITSIGEGAFSACSGLVGKLVIPDGVTSLASSVFAGVSGIEAIVFGEGLKEIYTNSTPNPALYGMTGVTEVTFTGTTVPTMTNTDYGPFEYMTSLETVYVPSEAYDDYVTAFASYLPDTAKIVPIGGVEDKGWDGSIAEPTQQVSIDGVTYYEISTAEELAYIAQTGGDWLGYNYILTNDIILNEELTYDEDGKLTVDESSLITWTPISRFSGIFDGADHTISGLFASGGGLFSYLWGELRNLKITNSYIRNSGGIAYCCYGIAQKCSFDGIVVCDDDTDLGAIGGLFCQAYGSSKKAEIEECYNYGKMICTNDTSVSGGLSAIGGIVGFISSPCIVNNCVNYGDIITTQALYSETIQMGVGGIVGQFFAGEINNCENHGNIMANNANYVGGIVGSRFGGGGDYGELGRITNSTNFGKVTGESYVAGIAGYITCAVGNIALENVYNMGDITGENYVGGLMGSSKNVTIKKSYSTGNVSGTTDVGALVGYSWSVWGKGSVEECYYLKTDTINTSLYGFGNYMDKEGVVRDKKAGFFPVLSDINADPSYDKLGYVNGELDNPIMIPDVEIIEPEIETVWDGTTLEPSVLVEENGILYYKIFTGKELAYVAQTGGDWLEYNYLLANDIILNTEQLTYDECGNITADLTTLNEWTEIPILYGTLDGAGYTIYGLYINKDLTDKSQRGCFLGMLYGELRNLNFKNSYVAAFNAYGICDSTYSNATNCSFEGAVRGVQVASGLFGWVNNKYENIKSIEIVNCNNYGDVYTITDDSSVLSGVQCAAGIAKYATFSYDQTISFKNCINYGNITLQQPDDSKAWVGGIVANSSAGAMMSFEGVLLSFENCQNVGKISSNALSGGTGGIAGYANRGVGYTNCANAGDIMGKNYVGGILGDTTAVTSATLNMTNCTNIGEITGGTNVGALVGTEKVEAISAESCYYLKTSTMNAEITGFANTEDVDSVVNAKEQSFFCINKDNTVNVSGHQYTGDDDIECDVCGECKGYIVTWIVDGVETTENYEAGQFPSFKGDTHKAADAQYIYTFAGWDKEITEVTGDVTYTATYTTTINSYTVTWMNFDGTVLATEEYAYGDTPEYKGEIPTFKGNTFTGWSPEVGAVECDITYTAQYGLLNGIVWVEEDGVQVGYYYVDGEVKKSAGLVQVGEYLYWVLSTGKIAVGTNRTIKASQTNGLIDPGTYYFLANGVLETEEVRLSGEVRWTEENGKTVGYYYVMDEIRKDVGLVELYNPDAEEECWYYVLYSGKVKKNNVADGKRVNQTVKANKLNKYTGPARAYSFYEDGVMYDPYATESGIVKYDDTGKPYYYVDGHIRKDAGLVYLTRGDLAGNYVFVTYSGTLKKGTQTVKASKCNGHTEFVGTQKFDSTTGAMIIK